MISDEDIAKAYDTLRRSRKPVTVVLEGVYVVKLRAFGAKTFERKQEREYVPEDSIVGTYTDIDYDAFKKDVEWVFSHFKPEIKITDLNGKKDRVIEIILSQKDSFSRADIAAKSGVSDCTAGKYIYQLRSEKKLVDVGYVQHSRGQRLYAVTGTLAAKKYSPSNNELVLAAILKNGPSAPAVIADRTGINRNTVKTTLSRLVGMGSVLRQKHGDASLYAAVEKNRSGEAA